MATVAEELCTMTVITTPATMPKIGVWEKLARKSRNTGLLEKPFTAPVMFIKPTNRIPKPMQISPTVLVLLDLMNITKMMPINNAIGARVSVSNSHSSQLSPASRKARFVSHAVMVVPMLAPRTMETACFNVRTPAPIKATARTMVAVELWITAVTKAPVRTPVTTLPVSFPRTFLRAAPELFFRPSPMISIP